MPTPSWQYHEPDHPGEDFDAIAEIYDQNMKKFRDVDREIQEILDFLDLKPDHAVLEIGTGTGEFALAAARHCAKVYAVDLSGGMLRYAGKKAASRNIRNIDFLQGGFLTYEHQGGLLDAAVTQIALHHLPDFWKQVALLRIADLLKAGGKFCLRDVVYSFDVAGYKDYFTKLIAQASNRSGEEFARSMSKHVKNEYSTLDWVMEGMIRQAGFDIISAEHKNGFFSLYLCIKKIARVDHWHAQAREAKL
jgi:ubiquinone/menaquinone biosynthesis C-methylase UbiE